VPLLRDGAEAFGLLVRVDSTPTGTLLSCLDEAGQQAGWEIFLENGKIGLAVKDAKGVVNARGVSGAVVAPGRWHHAMLVFDAASMRSRTIELYLDGRAVANSTISAHLPVDIVPSAPLRLGGRTAPAGGPAASLKGGDVWVQDLRRYQRSVLAPEV
jgi:hypothetical protein